MGIDERLTQEIVRRVLAVPGPVTSPLSAGPHRELREGGATLVTDAGQVVTQADLEAKHAQLLTREQ